jgi:hypothetical protein
MDVFMITQRLYWNSQHDHTRMCGLGAAHQVCVIDSLTLVYLPYFVPDRRLLTQVSPAYIRRTLIGN